VTVKVWIFGDLPLGRACGPSYMLESWQRELTRLGFRARTFTPSTGLRGRHRSPMAVTFRTLRDVAYTGDYHARFSAFAEVLRARRNRPQVIIVATLGRVGVLGLILAAVYSIPLVLVVSTDTTGAARYYSAPRVLSSVGVKPAVLLLVSRRIRAAFFRRSEHLRRGLSGWSRRLAAHSAAAVLAQAREVVLLSPKCLQYYGTAPAGTPVTVFPAGIDRLPLSPAPVEVTWRPGALRVLYVGRFAPEKNLPVLVQAVRAATDAGLDVHLNLVGEGPLHDRLVTEAERLGIADRVGVIGPYPRNELGGIYATAEVFAFPSMVDTQAFVLNEAAHEGLALLVSDTANSIVEDGVSALVVPPDPRDYAEGLARLRDERLRRRLGGAAQARAQRVGEAAQSARLAEVLRRAAGTPSALPAPLPAPLPALSVAAPTVVRIGDPVPADVVLLADVEAQPVTVCLPAVSLPAGIRPIAPGSGRIRPVARHATTEDGFSEGVPAR
jgi:1,2-diacylglycerol 3-alpha-glucosyltransferase